MENERINEHTFSKECDQLAQDIFDEIMGEAAADEDADHHRDTMQDRAHEAADGHQWVIYHHHAHQICAECNTDEGEQFLEETGMPETPTYDGLATIMAYGEMRYRIGAKLDELCDEWEPTEA